jgi:hypothetical protein
MRVGARVVGKRVGALVVGKRVGALVVGMATGATVVGAAVGVAANRMRISCWHMGRMGGGARGMSGGVGADLEVVLGVGSGTWQHRQQLRPPPPPSLSLLHEPHRPLTAASVARTSLRISPKSVKPCFPGIVVRKLHPP